MLAGAAARLRLDSSAMPRRPFGGALPVSDFVTQASIAGGTYVGELTRVDGAQEPTDRRRYHRVHLEASGALVLDSGHLEGPCDISRAGAGIIVPASPPAGSRVRIWLPPEEGEMGGLELEGRVARARLTVEPVRRGGRPLTTLHCFACRWTGYADPESGELRTSIERTSEEGRHGERTRVGAPLEAGLPDVCPTCAVGALSRIDRPYHAVGIDLSDLGWRDEERLLTYIERVVTRRADVDQRKHRRFLRDYVPAQVRCRVEDPVDLARVFAEEISQGGMGFVTGEEHALGEEVRLVLCAPAQAAGITLGARVVSRSAEEGKFRYGARFTNLDAEARAELRAFVEGVSGRKVQEHTTTAVLPLGGGGRMRQVLIGGALGLAIGLAVAILFALR